MDDREVTAGAVRFRYLEAGPADGPLVLCLHGFPDHALTWAKVLPGLAAAGLRAVAPWMPGYAPSAAPTEGGYGPAHLGAAVNALHRELGGDDRAAVVGHDWGAIAAYRAAAAEPSRWRRVVGMASPPEPVYMTSLASPAQARRLAYWLPLLAPGGAGRLAADDFAMARRLWQRWAPDRRPEDLAALERTWRAPGTADAMVAYYRAVVSGARDLARTQGAAGVPPQPTLYLHGRNDRCVLVGTAKRVRRFLRHPQSRVEIVPYAGHFLHLDQPGPVTRSIVGWVS